MPVAAGAVAALAGAAVAPTAVRPPAGGLLPLRRATAPLKARRAAPGRRVSVAARASLGEFPAWDAVNDAAINLHASVIASDLFQISDAAAAVERWGAGGDPTLALRTYASLFGCGACT